MSPDAFCERISADWLWRESELREMDARLLKSETEIEIKFGILLVYSHWEGHFKSCANELLKFISEGVRKKLFKWTDIRAEVRQRIFLQLQEIKYCGANTRDLYCLFECVT